MPRPLCVGPEPLRRSDRLGRPPPVGGPASAAWEALACPEPIQGYASVWVYPGAPVLSVLRQSDRRVRPPPGRRGAQPSLRPRGSFRLDRSAPAHPSACLGLDRSGSGRVGVAVFTHNRRNYGTRPRRGGRRCHHRVPSCTPRRASSRIARRLPCHGSPSDPIPPSLGAPAVRMDGGMGELQVRSRTRPRPCAKFPAASKFFLEPGWWR